MNRSISDFRGIFRFFHRNILSGKLVSDKPGTVQFVEIEDDVVFTVEYSVRGAMLAIYEFFGVEREIPEIYNGLLDPKVGLKALETVFH